MTRRYLAIMLAIVGIVTSTVYVACGSNDKVVLDGDKGEDRIPPEQLPPTPPNVDPSWQTFAEFEDETLRHANSLSDIESDSTRYINLSDQFNEGVSANEMEQARLAVKKALNSLSTERDIADIKTVDQNGTILAVDIRDLGWTSKTWCLIEDADPFKFESFTTRGLILKALTKTKRPWINADILIRTANNSNANFTTYYDILGLPVNEADFRRFIGVNLQAQFDNQEEELLVVGVQNPLITLGKNREAVRFDTPNGPAWYTSDFDDQFNDFKNLSTNPFPPEARSQRTYRHDAREYIFPLPNGMHGYYLSAGNGARANDAPINVVIDINAGGLNPVIILQKCMKCHNQGIIPVVDELGASIAANPNLGAEDKQRGRLLFKSQNTINEKIAEDNARYQNALKQIGLDPTLPDPANKLVDKLDKGLTAKQIGAKYHLKEADFINLLRGSGIAVNEVATLINGGSIDANKFADVNQVIIRELNIFRDDE